MDSYIRFFYKFLKELTLKKTTSHVFITDLIAVIISNKQSKVNNEKRGKGSLLRHRRHKHSRNRVQHDNYNHSPSASPHASHHQP